MTFLDPGIWTGSVFDGGWTAARAGDAPVVEPATGNELGRAGVAGPEDVAASAARARREQRAWA
ncbi:benzaldehyde dehydrogenase, partial [Nonomuraea sp. NPDC004297]